MLNLKIISSLEKCFLDNNPEDFSEIKSINIYKNTDASFQLLPFNMDEAKQARSYYKVTAEGDIAHLVTFRCVENIPNYIPHDHTPNLAKKTDPNFVRTTPGLYPDVLVPMQHTNWFAVINCQLRTMWVDVRNDGSISVGEHKLTVKLCDMSDNVVCSGDIIINVINAELPKQDTIVTQWFYADCIADYYDLKMWSKKHFEVCKRFVQTAVNNGVNMIMVPVFTPPLDTAIGGERTTTQLVKVKVIDGKYEFDLSLVDKWIDMLLSCGVEYLEISHLFTQWGAYHAPKIIAEVNGRKKKIFGWDTDASSKEYVAFLNAFLKKLTAYLTGKGLKDRTYFHISDEPVTEHLAQYKLNKQNLSKVLSGWKVLDALSHVEFYQQGVCEIPVPVSYSIEDFMKEDIKERWIYYCCGPSVGYSNRFMCMHLARTRFMGIQMYKYGISGFLQWGFNFYNDQYSHDHIDPFLNGNAGFWAGGGDAVSVYPGRHGIPLESIRIIAFKQGIEDIRALKLCEKYYSKDEIIKRIEEVYGAEIKMNKCADDTATMQKVRDLIDTMIIAKL